MSKVSDILMPSTYLRVMARTTPDVVRLLAGTGLTPRSLLEKPYITVAQQLACVRNSITMMRRPDWHLAWARHVGERFHGPVSAAWQSAPTLGDGIGVFARYMPKRIPYLSWRNNEGESGWALEIEPRMPLGELSDILVEAPLLSLVSYINAMRGGKVRDVAIELKHEPVVPPAVYRRWYRCTFHFRAQRNAVVVPRAWHVLPNVDYDPALWELALRKCRIAVDDRMRSLDFPAGTAAAVIGRLHEGLASARHDRGLPGFGEMAAALHLSPRTLSRRLAAESTSYQLLLDRARMPLAQDMLSRGIRIGEIANRLGYASPSSFDRAFIRWFGAPPRDVRPAESKARVPDPRLAGY